jgi:hypothetical protein
MSGLPPSKREKEIRPLEGPGVRLEHEESAPSWGFGLFCAFLVAAVIGGSLAVVTWPREMEIRPETRVPAARVAIDQAAVALPGYQLVATIPAPRDELEAYLQFQYLRSFRGMDRAETLLTVREEKGAPAYRMMFIPENNLLTAVPYLEELRTRGYFEEYRIGWLPDHEVNRKRQQNRIFEAAYNLPVRRRLELLQGQDVIQPLVRFLLFKSRNEIRVRKQMEPLPQVLSTDEARQLAADILAVADFYYLPLDFFLGIGAQENNYMDVTGDLEHSVWKRRPEQGDIVLRRRGNRVLVKNYSIGVWQITRETLRYAHNLYLEDGRDYELLPERLRPPKELDLDLAENRSVLTTYAGLLLRDLLDQFDGDWEQAVGAYNGGVKNPNLRYAAGVASAAEHARKAMEQAAALSGRSVAETKFLLPGKPIPEEAQVRRKRRFRY